MPSDEQPGSFGECSFCEQGDLFAVVSERYGVVLMCGECELLRRSPKDLTPIDSDHSFRSLPWATKKQVQEAGWDLPEKPFETSKQP